jgi:hypothetical protein
MQSHIPVPVSTNRPGLPASTGAAAVSSMREAGCVCTRRSTSARFTWFASHVAMSEHGPARSSPASSDPTKRKFFESLGTPHRFLASPALYALAVSAVTCAASVSKLTPFMPGNRADRVPRTLSNDRKNRPPYDTKTDPLHPGQLDFSALPSRPADKPTAK